MLLDGRVGAGQHEDLVLDERIAQGLVAGFVEEFVERRVDPAAKCPLSGVRARVVVMRGAERVGDETGRRRQTGGSFEGDNEVAHMGADVVEVEVGDGGGVASVRRVITVSWSRRPSSDSTTSLPRPSVGSGRRSMRPADSNRLRVAVRPPEVCTTNRATSLGRAVCSGVHEVGQHSNLGGRGGGLGTDIGCHRIGQPTETAQEEGEGQGIHLDETIFPQSFVASGWVGRGAVPHPVNIVSS